MILASGILLIVCPLISLLASGILLIVCPLISLVVAKGIRFIREHLAEPITNESISRASGLSRTLFQKRFREVSGQSIREFILARRLERALMLITTTDIPLGEVAAFCGFRHQEYLGQVVKRSTGTTPGALRREGRT